MYFVAFLKFASFLSIKSVVSSANVSARDSFVAYVIPVMFLVVVILISRISTMIMKRYGDITSPCGTPCSRFMQSVKCPPRRICASLFRRKVLIHVMMSGPKPSVLSVLNIKVCDKESNAFLKSMSRMSPDFFVLMVFLIKLMRLMRQLPMLLCLMYAFCCHPIIDSTAGFIRCVIAQDASL